MYPLYEKWVTSMVRRAAAITAASIAENVFCCQVERANTYAYLSLSIILSLLYLLRNIIVCRVS